MFEYCNQLQSFLEYKEYCDIYGNELFQELKHLKTLLPKDVTKSIDILNTIKSYWEKGGFQTVWVAYRILLTIPVTVASMEMSFSKLKLIKTYLRTTMSQERLRVCLAPRCHEAKQRSEPKSQNWMSLGQGIIRICDFKNAKF